MSRVSRRNEDNEKKFVSKNIAIALGVACLILLLGLVWSTLNYYSVAQAKEGYEKLKIENQYLSDKISSLQKQYDDLKRSYEVLYNENIKLRNEVSSLNSQIDSLKSRIGSSLTKILGVYFSPKGGCKNQIIYWISRANRSVHVLIYSFTLSEIADALIEAKNRGIDVKVVFEKDQVSKYSQYFRLARAGVSVRNDTNPNYMHNKVAIIDGVIVLTGSYNWSDSAEYYNNENLIIIRDEDVASMYESIFEKLWEYGR